MVELKACPFCEDEAEKMRDKKGNRWIECKRCGARSYNSDHITYAAHNWNIRPLEAKYEKLLALVKDVVRTLDHLEIQPHSLMHKYAKKLLNEIGESE